MASRRVDGDKKFPYEKPSLRVIELAAEEVLGIGCKLDGATPFVPTGVTCLDTPCNVQGS